MLRIWLSLVKALQNAIRSLLKIAHAIDQLTNQVGKLAIALVLVLVGVGFYNVVARYTGRLIGLQLSSNALIELQWYLFSLVFLFGFAYILKSGANVRVDFLYVQWSDRRKALVDFLGTVLFLIPFCILGMFVTVNPVLASWRIWELSPDANGLPRAPIKTMIIVGFGLLLLQAIAQAIKYLAILTGYAQASDLLRDETANPLPFE
ncbi:MAG: TRAP transporter small permease subunit [Cyanobacteria bacterium J069]